MSDIVEYNYNEKGENNMVNAITENVLEQYYATSNIAGDSIMGIDGLILSIFSILSAILSIILFIILVEVVISVIARWRIFTKAGEKGWKALIPIYNKVILFKISGISPWLILGYLGIFIPFVGGLICTAIFVYSAISLAKAFGKGTEFTVGLIVLNTIFTIILAFGKSEYQLKNEEAENIDITEEL